MPKLVITTVGTSLMEKVGLESTRNWVGTKLSNDVDKLLTGNVLGQSRHDKVAQEYLSKVVLLKDYSAEIASLHLMRLHKVNDRVVLLFSDTPSGAFCARANALYIDKQIAHCKLGTDAGKDTRKIPGLEAASAKAFLFGLNSLPSLLTDLCNEAKDEGRDLVINITGGYKGVIPFLSFFALRKQKEICYLYEESELVHIPPNLIVESTDANGNITGTASIQFGPL